MEGFIPGVVNHLSSLRVSSKMVIGMKVKNYIWRLLKMGTKEIYFLVML